MGFRILLIAVFVNPIQLLYFHGRQRIACLKAPLVMLSGPVVGKSTVSIRHGGINGYLSAGQAPRHSDVMVPTTILKSSQVIE